MWPDVWAALPPVWLILGGFLIAGTVKGIAGVGLPMTALGILTLETDPRTAIALSMAPILLANLWQFLNAGGAVAAIRRYLPFLVVMVVGIPLTIALTAGASEATLFGALGAMFLFHVALTATRWAPRIPDAADTPAQIGFGAAAGVLGGLVSLWLPAIVIYLGARNVSKDEFVRATGLLLFAGSLPLVAGYWREGFLTGPLAAASALMLVPTLLGMTLGAKVRGRLSEAAFKQILLVVFVVIGLNLIRRAITG
ncbi:MAG: sulfite exporter TauE/SafE family protein [Rhodobacteraceae bacterium]|nr:MAG: sulfite exporter TauE/SafE family protein [Paracoccaceae bacterium]